MMFEVEDFIICVEALVLGTEHVEKILFQPLSSSSGSTIHSFRATGGGKDGDGEGRGNDRVKNNNDDDDDDDNDNSSNSCVGILKFIEIFFRHEYNAKRKVNVPAAQIGALFDMKKANEDDADDGEEPSSLLVLSKTLSREDIMNHFMAMDVSLEMEDDDELLRLAQVFVKALLSFCAGLAVDDTEQVVLTYQGLGTSSISFKDGTRQFLKTSMALYFFSCSTSSSSYHGNVEDYATSERIKSILQRVHASRKPPVDGGEDKAPASAAAFSAQATAKETTTTTTSASSPTTKNKNHKDILQSSQEERPAKKQKKITGPTRQNKKGRKGKLL